MEKYPLIIGTAGLLRIVISRRGSMRPGFMAALALTVFLGLGALVPVPARAIQVSEVMVKIEGAHLVVNASLTLDESQVTEIRKGLKKELVFYVDLFKVWGFWPDEFIQGLKVYRTMKSDPVKGEFILVSVENGAERELRFNSADSLLAKALAIESVQISIAPDVDPGDYYVKVTVESKILKMSPIVSNLLFFIPEREFKVSNRSAVFRLGVQ
ncbi:MAG: DUF4390 domain-containing protein [Thermodesulfovibrionales bacterium]